MEESGVPIPTGRLAPHVELRALVFLLIQACFDNRKRDNGVLSVREGKMNRALFERLGDGIVEKYLWGAGGFVHHFNILPAKDAAPTRLHRFADSLFCRKPRRKVLLGILFGTAVRNLGVREHAVDKGCALF